MNIETESVNPGFEILQKYRALPPTSGGSMARLALVDCVGCQWATTKETGDKRAFLSDIEVCSGFNRTTITAITKRLARANVFNIEYIKHETRMGPKDCMSIVPSESPIGIAFSEAVQPPDKCQLKGNEDNVSY